MYKIPSIELAYLQDFESLFTEVWWAWFTCVLLHQAKIEEILIISEQRSWSNRLKGIFNILLSCSVLQKHIHLVHGNCKDDELATLPLFVTFCLTVWHFTSQSVPHKHGVVQDLSNHRRKDGRPDLFNPYPLLFLDGFCVAHFTNILLQALHLDPPFNKSQCQAWISSLVEFVWEAIRVMWPVLKCMWAQVGWDDIMKECLKLRMSTFTKHLPKVFEF